MGVQRVSFGPLLRREKKKKRVEEKRTRELQEDEVISRNRIIMVKNIKKTPVVSTTGLQGLPLDLVIGNILSRLPINSFGRFSCVSKFWYKTTRNEKNPILMFQFFNVGYVMEDKKDQYFFYAEKEDICMISNDVNAGRMKLRTLFSTPIGGVGGGLCTVLVGHCNGLVCLSSVCRKRGRLIQFYNPSRREIFVTVPSIKVTLSMKAYGFGYNSLTKEYKVVCIVKGLKYCLVYTLGSNSWREIKGPSPLFKSSSNCGIPNCGDLNCGKFAISCDGALFWKIRGTSNFLLFDLHNEKFRVIVKPEMDWVWSEQICWRFLEFKGSLCIARIEKFLEPDEQTSKVHLHILKDKAKQVWVKETFFVPFACETTTRVVSFCDQVLLYWSFGEFFQFYNLHTKVSKLLHYPGGPILEKKYRRDLRNTNHTGYGIQLCSQHSLARDLSSPRSSGNRNKVFLW